MTIEARKIEVAKQLLTIEDESILEEVQWILERSDKIDSVLRASIKTGIQQAEAGQGVDHQSAKKVYTKWL